MKKINFESNEICSVKTINKTNFPNLTSLYFTKNPLNQIDFCRARFKKSIKEVFLQRIFNMDVTSNLNINDISLFLKI
jgi:Leucine-rich repeat (LRR) protein